MNYLFKFYLSTHIIVRHTLKYKKEIKGYCDGILRKEIDGWKI